MLPPRLQHRVKALRAATVLLVRPPEPVPAANVTGHTFTPRRLDDPGRLVAAAISATPYRYHAEVRFAISAEDLAKRVAPSVGVVEADDAGSLLRLGADDATWLASYLIGLGLPFEVVRPAELRGELHELAARSAQVHTPR